MTKFSSEINRIKLSQTNRNDCAITSLSVFEGISYEKAFEIFGRSYKPKSGTRNFAIYDYMAERYECISFNRNTHYVIKYRYNTTLNDKASGLPLTISEKGITIKSFAKKYNKGKYFIIVSGHALVVDNGTIIDTAYTTDATRVRIAWKLK